PRRSPIHACLALQNKEPDTFDGEFGRRSAGPPTASAGLRFRFIGARPPDHFNQHAAGIVAIGNLSQKSHTTAMDPIARLQPEVESEAIHGRHRRLTWLLAHIMPGE